MKGFCGPWGHETRHKDVSNFKVLEVRKEEAQEEENISKLFSRSSNLSADNWRAVPPPCEICQ